MKKSLLLVFMAGMLSFSVLAKSEGPALPSIKQAGEIEKVQPEKVAQAADQLERFFKLIKVTIETTCGENVYFDFQPAPGATIAEMETLLAEEASWWNFIYCDEFHDDWGFVWS